MPKPALRFAPKVTPESSVVERLATCCRDLLPLVDVGASLRPAYDVLPLCVIDAVWSPHVRYDAVKAVLSRFCAWAGLPSPFASATGIVSPFPPVSLRAFVAGMERLGTERFTDEVFCNRQRTSAKGGILKAEAVYRFAVALREHGADNVADVGALRGDPSFERDIFAIPGQSSGISLRYFYILCGAQDLVKPDRHIVDFVAGAVGRGILSDEAADLLTSVCDVLTADCPGLTPHALNHAISRYQRTAGPIPTASSEPSLPVAKTETKREKDAPSRAEVVPPVALHSIESVTVAATPMPPPARPARTKEPLVSERSENPPSPATDTAAPVSDSARYSVRIRELPTDERPRERLIQHGPEAVSTAELLAILLRTGTEKRSAVGLAEHLLSEHGGLRGVARMTVEELSAIHGLGPAKAAQIKAAIEFGRRLVAASPEERPKIRCPQDVYNLLGPTLRDEKREHFIALLLDTKGGVMRQRTVSIGDLSSSIVHPREVFLEAVRHSAASLIVSHNHPSGDPTPSSEDVTVTRRLVEAGEMLGIDVLDHVIVGDNRWYSLKEKGLM